MDSLADSTAPDIARETPAAQAGAGDWRDRLAFGKLRLAAVALPLALAAGFAAWSWFQVEERARERATQTVRLVAAQVERALEVQDAVIEAVQAQANGMSWAEIAASLEVWALLQRLDQAAPNTNRVGMIDPDGVLVQISSAFPAPATRHGDRDFVAALRAATEDRPVLGAPVVGRTSGHKVLPYARPRLGAGGRPDGGVIWSTLRTEDLTTLFGKAGRPGDMVALVRGDGTVLACCAPAPAGTPPPLLPQDATIMLAVRAALADGVGMAVGPSRLDGRERLHAALQVGHLDAAVVYGSSVAAMRLAWLTQTAWMAVPAALTSALLLVLTRRGQMAVRREIESQEAARVAAEQRAAAEAARADLEAILRQAQRMDTLGRIAAGLVHDVRNTMQAVQAGVSMIERATARGDTERVREVTAMLHEAVGRAGQLTQRLLARGAEGGEGRCEPGPTVAATCQLLQSALGPRYRLVQRLEAGLPRLVRASQAELDSALVNLVVNARDAMPAGGEIVVAGWAAAQAPSLAEGSYLALSVTDSGVGMDEATMARATQTFFTTKGRDGSGLGLASIHAFVTGNGGTMTLRSAPGAGTTVTLFLPEAR